MIFMRKRNIYLFPNEDLKCANVMHRGKRNKFDLY